MIKQNSFLVRKKKARERQRDPHLHRRDAASRRHRRRHSSRFVVVVVLKRESHQ